MSGIAQDRELHPAINLLPWRVRSIHRRRRFVLGQLSVAVAIVVLIMGVTTYLLARETSRLVEQRHALTLTLDQMKPRVDLAVATSNELARWRGFAAKEPMARRSQQRVLDFLRDLSAQSASGLTLSSVEFNGVLVEVKGTTQSKAMAVDFVRGMKGRGWPAAAPTVGMGDGTKTFAFLVKPKVKKRK